MNLTILATDFKPNLGGIAELAWQVCRDLAARGHRVDVLTFRTPDLPDREDAEGMAIHRLFDKRPPRSIYSPRGIVEVPLWSLRTRRAVARFLHAHRPDAILCTNVATLWGAVLRNAAVPYALFVHGDDVAGMFRKRNPIPLARFRRLARGAGWVFFNSDASRQSTAASAPEATARSSVVGCGYPPEDIVAGEHRRPARAQLGWGEEPVVLSVCRLVLRKGVDTAIHALAHVRESFPDCRYVVAGDGPDRAQLQALAALEHPDGAVQFLGRVSDDDRRTLLLAADVYVMASRPGPEGESEGFGIGFLEANAHGLPVVGARTGGIPEAVTDGVNGLLVPPSDPAALGAALTSLLADPALRARLAAAGQQRIRDTFNWRRIGGDIESRLTAMVK